MAETFFVSNIVLAILFWAIVYTSDYFCTIYAARLYLEGANQHFGFGGSLELSPYYQKDIDHLKTISPRFVLMLILTSAIVLGIWMLSVPILNLPGLFSFMLGALVLMEAAIHVRHFRNIFLFRNARQGNGIAGKIEYERWLVLQSSAVEFLGFAIIYLFALFVSGSWFFAGGAAGCLSVGIRHWMWGSKAKIRNT